MPRPEVAARSFHVRSNGASDETEQARAAGMGRMGNIVIPVLRSARLTLRAFRAEDIDEYAPIRADPEVGRFVGGPRTREETWDRMAVMNGQWVLRGYGVFAVEEAVTGRLIGHCGVLHPIDWPEPEIAYSLGPAHWGRGFAPEAARTARDWAFERGGLPALVSFIDPLNVRSIRVAEKLGATREGTLTLRGHTVHCWRHTRPKAA